MTRWHGSGYFPYTEGCGFGLPESSFPPDKSTPGAIRGRTARGLDLFEMARQPKVELYERISLLVDLCALEGHGA